MIVDAYPDCSQCVTGQAGSCAIPLLHFALVWKHHMIVRKTGIRQRQFKHDIQGWLAENGGVHIYNERLGGWVETMGCNRAG